MDSPRSRRDQGRLEERCEAVALPAGPDLPGGAGSSEEAGATRTLRLIGLGVRGGLVVVGVEQVRKAVQSSKIRLAVVAADVSHNSREKIVPLLQARGVSMIETASATMLGRAVGRDTTAVVGVLDAKLARGIQAAHGEIRRKG